MSIFCSFWFFVMVLTEISVSILTYSCCYRGDVQHSPNRAAFIPFVQVVVTLNDLHSSPHPSSFTVLVRALLPCCLLFPTFPKGSGAIGTFTPPGFFASPGFCHLSGTWGDATQCCVVPLGISVPLTHCLRESVTEPGR